MNIQEFPEFDNHEKVLELKLPVDGVNVQAFIAVHRTKNGKAIGGTRILKYQSSKEAMKDVLNLSRGMTYKCLLANIPYGGGKGVIFVDPTSVNMGRLLEKYAEEVNKLGIFYTGEDVGMSKEAVEILGKHSKFIIGLPSKTGIPAPYAAQGVFAAMRGSAEHVFNSGDLSGKKIAIKGLGAVGSSLATLVLKEGAYVVGADIAEGQVQKFEGIKNFKSISVDDIHKEEVDIYSPCALGYDLNTERVNELNCKIVCGAANNQLASEEVANKLFEKGIVYVPDYIANAGGLIHVADELEAGGYSQERVKKRIELIRGRVREILDKSSKKSLNQSIVAQKIATKLNGG